MKRLSKRLLVAVVSFAVAAVWTGIGLQPAFECLVVFGVAFVVSGLVGRDETARSRTRHAPRARRDDRRTRPSSAARAPRPVSSRSGRSAVYDADEHGFASVADSAW